MIPVNKVLLLTSCVLEDSGRYLIAVAISGNFRGFCDPPEIGYREREDATSWLQRPVYVNRGEDKIANYKDYSKHIEVVTILPMNIQYTDSESIHGHLALLAPFANDKTRLSVYQMACIFLCYHPICSFEGTLETELC